jgi:predicted nucleotidyltransferase
VKAVSLLQQFFARQRDVVAVYLYGTYATDQTWPDSDIEIALLFADHVQEEEIGACMERLSSDNPLEDVPGILMPFALNTHILPVIYEILTGGTVIVNNDPAAREAFARQAASRLDAEKRALLDEAGEAIAQARNLGLVMLDTPGFVPPRPPKSLDPIRIGWRLARVLASAAVLEPATRDVEATGRDPERLGQLIGWFNNAAGAATGIAKAMLNMFGMARPPRRWEVFLPLADAKLLPMALALQLGAAVELRWQLLTSSGLASPERIAHGIRSALPHIVSCARLAAWYCEVPGARVEQKLH